MDFSKCKIVMVSSGNYYFDVVLEDEDGRMFSDRKIENKILNKYPPLTDQEKEKQHWRRKRRIAQQIKKKNRRREK